MKNSFSHKVLDWYYYHGRELPWRQKDPQNPYYIWISEIMLQQTSVAKVIPFFKKFIETFPTIFHVARASEDDVLFLWQGLGYYSRARNFHKAAQQLVQNSFADSVVFPQREEEWRLLPGVGPYTAAAIAAIVYQQPTIPLDVNILRVFRRYLHRSDFSHKKAREFFLTDEGKSFFAQAYHGDYVQALMELGQFICLQKKKPLCSVCPVAETCASQKIGYIPSEEVSAPKPQRKGHVFIFKDDGMRKIMVWKNLDYTLLKGLFGFPVTSFFTDECPDIHLDKDMIFLGTVDHSFTHFHIHLSVWKGKWKTFPYKEFLAQGEFLWVSEDDLHQMAFSTLMRKVQSYAG